MRVFAVYNIKGGVGKTATAVNLAYLSAASGARTLLWDLDPQGAAGFYFRVNPRSAGGAKRLIRNKNKLARHVVGTDYDGLELLPADFSHRHLDLALDELRRPQRRISRLLRPLGGAYDHVYIDCAPSISLVSEGVFNAADALLVPTIPTTLSLRTLHQLAEHLTTNKVEGLEVLPFFCMVDSRRAVQRQFCEAANGPYPFLDARIPYSSVVERMGTQRAPVGAFAARSDAWAAYQSLWHETLTRMGSWIGWLADSPRRGRH